MFETFLIHETHRLWVIAWDNPKDKGIFYLDNQPRIGINFKENPDFKHGPERPYK